LAAEKRAVGYGSGWVEWRVFYRIIWRVAVTAETTATDVLRRRTEEAKRCCVAAYENTEAWDMCSKPVGDERS